MRRASHWFELCGPSVRQPARATSPVTDWTTRLGTLGNRFEDAETGPTVNFNRIDNSRDRRALT